jgi:hypothetical protein
MIGFDGLGERWPFDVVKMSTTTILPAFSHCHDPRRSELTRYKSITEVVEIEPHHTLAWVGSVFGF